MQNRLTVTIAGQKFSLVADEPEAYMKEIAALADQKIAEAKKLVGNTTFSTGVLATLNMADEAVKLRHQCEEYKNQAQEQQEALAKSKSELGLMQDELDTMRRARPDEDPAVLLAEIKRLEKELDTAHNLHDSVCAESDAEMARLNGLIDQLTRDRDQAKARLSDMDALQMRIQALTRETQELREELTRAQAEKAAAVHEQENSLQSEIEQLNAALDALHVKESTQSAEAQDQIDALNKQIESLNEEIEILRGARTDTEPLYAEIRNLQNALDAKEKQVSENIQLKEEIEGLKHKLVENDPEPLRNEIRNLQNALDTKEKQVGENSRLKAQIEELDERLKRNDPAPLYAQIRQLQAALDERRSQADENARLRDEMQRLRDSYHDVRPTVEFEQLNKELTDVKAELSKAKIQLAGREIGEIGELRRELTRLRQLEKDYNNMEDPEPLHAEIDRLQEEVKRAHLETLEAEKKAAPQHDAGDLAEIERLKQELENAHKAAEQPAPAAETVNEQPDERDAEMQALQAELKKVKAELNRQIQINQSQAPRGKKKKGGK